MNVMQLPELDKLVLNTGIGGKAVSDRKRTVEALFMMELITGQKANITRAKKSIDQFQLREKMPIGCKVTLRKQNAYGFLDRLINTALPNVEGFAPIRGKRGNGMAPMEWSQWSPPTGQMKPANGMKPALEMDSAAAYNGEEEARREEPGIVRLLQQHKPISFSLFAGHAAQGNSGLRECKVWSPALGIRDAFVFREMQSHYDKFDGRYGIDILIVPKGTRKGRELLPLPTYFLSCFQMP